MKTKTYILTEEEILIVRDALIEERQRLRQHDRERSAEQPLSPHGERVRALLGALADQFKNDARAI